METSTLLFAQQGIKAVRLSEDTITVYYVDGNEPLHINKDDKLYNFHLENFSKIVESNLIPKEPTTEKVD